MPKPRTWLFIALGVVALLIGGVLALVGAGAWFFSRHVQIQETTTASATETFEDLRRRFEGQAPLIDVDAEGRATVAELDRRRASYNGPLPETLRLAVWDKREQRVVRLSFPMWMLRFQRDEALKLDVDGVTLDSLGVTIEDLRLAGPALVLDRDDGRNRVLMWTE